jgi:Domain of unknown function (DUF4440)
MDELERLERDGWDALSGPDGAAFYEQWMADAGLMVFPGLVMGKQTAIDTMRAVAPWSSYELTDVRVVRSGADAGLVTYRASAVRGDAPYEATMSSVYVRVDGAWRLLLHQQSPG